MSITVAQTVDVGIALSTKILLIEWLAPELLDFVAASAEEDALQVGNAYTPVDTGYLVSRNEVRVMYQGGGSFLEELYNDADYAQYVAQGHHTRSGSWVEAQDWITPALERGAQSLRARLEAISLTDILLAA
jgi:hypothetical protein